MRFPRTAAPSSLLLLVLLAACDDTPGSLFGTSAVGLSVAVSPRVDTIRVTDTLRASDVVQLAATVRSAATPGPVSVPVEWRSADPTIASVDGSGLVTARRLGTTAITAEVNGKTSTATVTVAHRTASLQVEPASVVLSVDDPIVAGDSVRLMGVARDRDGVIVAGTRLTWTSSAPGVAVADPTGRVRATGLGSATVTVRGNGVTGTGTVTVRPLVKAVAVRSPVTQVLALDTVQLSATATGHDDRTLAGRRFAWRSSNVAAATVDSTGRAHVLGAGTAAISATTGYVTGAVNVEVLPRALVFLDAGSDFTCAGAYLGRGYCWGREGNGVLGTPADSLCQEVPGRDEGCTLSPRRFGAGITFQSVSAGATSACGIGSDSHVYCWGEDTQGQLGDGVRGTPVSGSVVRATVGTVRFRQVSVGGAHACAVSTTDRIYCWGADGLGQLGDARRLNSTTPIPLAPSTEALRWAQVTAGEDHTCGLTVAGDAWCWGSNADGQLGDGSLVTRDVPVPVTGGLTFREVSAGGRHTCGVTTGGRVYCWGANQAGQSGLLQPSLVPAEVANVSGMTAVSAGRAHTCSLGADGRISCWGLNAWGQLGNDATGGQSAIPVLVGGGPYLAVSAGDRHTCAMGTGDEAWCWGSNVFGALGNELQAAARGVPQQVARPR